MNIERLNQITRANTGFDSFQQMLDAQGNYRPSMDQRQKVMVELADAYDAAQADRNDERRAYRYGQPAQRTLADVASDARQRAAKLRKDTARKLGGYVKNREAQIAAIQNDVEVDTLFVVPSKLTGKLLEQFMADAIKANGVGLEFVIVLGCDYYESFYEFVNGGEYEPMVGEDCIEFK